MGGVPMLRARPDTLDARGGYTAGPQTRWPDRDVRPSEVLTRNFWFCTIDDPSTIDTRHRIGVDRIMVETDYPHGDGTWPDTQSVIERCWGHLPPEELAMICHRNAAALFRQPLPYRSLPRP